MNNARATPAASAPYLPIEERPLGWRESALRGLDPLSPEAFRIRSAAMSAEERDYWATEAEAIEADIAASSRPRAPTIAAQSGASGFAALSYDLAAECALVCAAMGRPATLVGCGLSAKHFYDPALGGLFVFCEALHAKEGVEKIYPLLPERLPPSSWWAQAWETEARALLRWIVVTFNDADSVEAVATVKELARARGVA